jgi:hypothetical protein
VASDGRAPRAASATGEAGENVNATQFAEQRFVKLPENFTADNREFFQVWRGNASVVYGRSARSDESAHYYCAWATRVVANIEMLAERIKISTRLDECIDACAKYEAL